MRSLHIYLRPTGWQRFWIWIDHLGTISVAIGLLVWYLWLIGIIS